MNVSLFSLFFTFFAGSWLSNLAIIHTTTALLQSSSLELILAVSSCAGLSFFVLLRFLSRFSKSNIAAWLMLPVFGTTAVLRAYYPEFPVWPALSALLFGELIKYHAYSQVLNRFGPLSAGRIMGWAVLAYELGTISAALSARFESGLLIHVLEAVAIVGVYLPFFVGQADEDENARQQGAASTLAPTSLLPWLVGLGVLAGFLKVSADTGFKFALSVTQENVGQEVSNFYLYSALFTLALSVVRKFRWLAPRMGCPEASLMGLAVAQGLFGMALFSGNIQAMVYAGALQRSVDKIFYQPTLQLLTSGFTPPVQELLRRWHVTAFLALGSFIGLIAFMGHGYLGAPNIVMKGMSVAHIVAVLVIAFVAGKLIQKIVQALDVETRKAGALGGSRPMAMLALLSPRHFLVHALMWSGRRGGSMQGLPPEILQGLTADAGGEVVNSFYAAFPRLDETHQLALIRLAVFLDRKQDREFLLSIAEEKVPCVRRARRLAAMHVVKIHGRIYRPLLRRSRGKKSPLPVNKKAA